MTRTQSFDILQSVYEELRERFLVWDAVRRGPHVGVFGAHDAWTGKRVLLHVVARSALVRARIAGLEDRYREALNAAQSLEHPAIARILATGTTRSFEWHVTESVDRFTRLENLLETGGSLAPDRIVQVARQIAGALAYAHGHGVPHGALAPAAVYMGDDGKVLIDEFCTRRILTLLDAGPGSPSAGHGAAERLAMSPDNIAVQDRAALALLIQECRAGRPVVAVHRDLAAAPGGQDVVAASYIELQRLVDAAPALSDAHESALAPVVGDNGAGRLPEVQGLQSLLGALPLIEPHRDARLIGTSEPAEPERVVFLEQPLFDPTPEEPPPARNSSTLLLMTVVLTAGITWWLVTEVIPRPGAGGGPDTVVVTKYVDVPNDAANERGTPNESLTARTPAQPGSSGSPAVVQSVQERTTQLRASGVAAAGADSDPRTTAARNQSAGSSQNNSVVAPPAARSAPQQVVADAGRRGSAGDAAGRSAPTVSETERNRNRGASQPRQDGGTTVLRDAAGVKAAALESGRLSISTRPWGNLYVDGIRMGDTPAADIVLTAGAHRVRVVRDGYQTYEREIAVAPGGRVLLADIMLVRQAP